MANKRVSDFIGGERKEGNMNEYVRLSDLKKVPGIGAKTMERIRAECEIFTLDEESKKSEKNEKLYTWLDELLESEGG
jgi:Holliday junction resolvasome RuvABC DNA-binding subunit